MSPVRHCMPPRDEALISPGCKGFVPVAAQCRGTLRASTCSPPLSILTGAERLIRTGKVLVATSHCGRR